MAKTITYLKKGYRTKFGHEGGWSFVSEPYSDERYNSLLLLQGFGAIRNLKVS